MNIEKPTSDKFYPVTSENPFSHISRPAIVGGKQRAVGNAVLEFGVGDIYSSSDHESFRVNPADYPMSPTNALEFTHPIQETPVQKATQTVENPQFTS